MQDQLTVSRTEIETRSFISRVYGWMTGGLLMTGLVSLYMASDPTLIVQLVSHKFLFYGLMIAELGLVIVLAGWVQRMSATAATGAFLLYAGLTGVTLSTVFLAYTGGSIASTFFVTAATFGAMSLYGSVTKTDLTSFGNICIMALVGIILASIVNIFLNSTALYWVTTYIGILVFVGLTAYDTQRIRMMSVQGDEDAERRAAITGALALYLDFINLFVTMLRLTGRRR